MRISDWSSDVCSSDLQRAADLFGHARVDRGLQSHDGARLEIVADRAAGALDGTQVRAMVLVHRGRNGDGEEGAVAQALGIGGDLEPRGFQLVLAIGRASCRERVCQYV